MKALELLRSARPSAVALSLSMAACGGINFDGSDGGSRGCASGGANDGIKQPGNNPGGVDLAYGDLAVSPDGTYVAFDHAERLAVARVDTGVVTELPVAQPSRLGFASKAHVVYVSSTADGKIHAVDADRAETLWSTDLGEFLDGFLAVSADDAHLAFAASDTLWLLDTSDGHVVHSAPLERPPVDLEFLPDDRRVLAVELHTFEDGAPAGSDAATFAKTRIDVLDVGTGAVRTVSVPNCSDDLVVTGDGTRALLAPTVCSKDPISVVDLTEGDESFVKNLPGFGPVVIAEDGVTAVGFLDANQVDAALFDDSSRIPKPGAFHLMVIDSQTLDYSFYEYGPSLPRYALTPNGKLLLVDDAGGFSPGRLFDMTTRSFDWIDGPALRYEQAALSSDSSHAYVLSNPTITNRGRARGRGRRGRADFGLGFQLFDLDLDGAKASELSPGFLPWNVNIAPDDGSLFLRKSSTEVCVFGLDSESCEQVLTLSF